MVAEMLQKYTFTFNTLLSKKLYIFIFNENKYIFVYKNYIYLKIKENMFIFNQNIFVLKTIFISIRLFSYKKYIFIQSKENGFIEIFYLTILGSQICSGLQVFSKVA